jgi:peptidoglycan hydrolase-like protein with peptidoglycan-binding domain
MNHRATNWRWPGATRASVLGMTAIAALMITPTSLGGTRSSVAALQVALKSRGLYAGAIDGVIGPHTAAAVRVFQRRHQLTVDGIPGPITCAALGRYSRHRLGTRTITVGDTGWDVAETQFLLRSHGYSPGPLDASYGALSVAAVRRFQRHSDLQVDGFVGPATLASLDGERATGPGGLTTTGLERRDGLSSSGATRIGSTSTRVLDRSGSSLWPPGAPGLRRPRAGFES